VNTFLDLLNSFQDTLKVVLGAFIGILGSVVAAHLQNWTRKKHQREELLLKSIQLSMHALGYYRAVAYAKSEDRKTLIELPDNPADQLTAIVLVHFPTAFPLCQKLHAQLQDLHSYPHDSPGAANAYIELGATVANTVTEIIRELNDVGIREKIGQPCPPKSK
jgi:hypothetical protein